MSSVRVATAAAFAALALILAAAHPNDAPATIKSVVSPSPAQIGIARSARQISEI